MSFNHSPSIVKSGLVLCLDAKDLKSYSGSGTTWVDRSGNGNNANLSAGTTFVTNKFDFTGDTNALCRTTLPASSIGNYCTVIVTASLRGYGTVASGANRLVSLDRATGSTKWAISTNLALGGIQFTGRVGEDVAQTIPIQLNEIFQIALVLNNNNYKLYKNSNLIFNTTSNPDVAGFGNVAIGCRDSATDRTWNGNIYNCQIYNRLLSPEEILQNYNATKSRFQL